MHHYWCWDAIRILTPKVTETVAGSRNSEQVSIFVIFFLNMIILKLYIAYCKSKFSFRTHMKEKFLADLKKLKEQYTGPELKEALYAIRKRLDDPNVLSGEVVLNMLFCFRDIQDYDAMVQLVDDLKSLPVSRKFVNSYILYWYAFALNRRKQAEDREKALKVCLTALEKVKIIYIYDILFLFDISMNIKILYLFMFLFKC